MLGALVILALGALDVGGRVLWRWVHGSASIRLAGLGGESGGKGRDAGLRLRARVIGPACRATPTNVRGLRLLANVTATYTAI
jgi:hypothetical protein